MNGKKKVIILVVILAVIILSILVIGLLFYNGVIWSNNPKKEEYPVRGVDVSSYQGDIDWKVLSGQDISFAYMKATEGSSFVDKYFQNNWNEANKTELKVGAYHFFSYDSEGKSQAENFIHNVPILEGAMPPVVDIEFYGDKEKNIPDKEKTKKELTDMLDRLEEHYKVKPVIYTTQKVYSLYISDNFKEYPIWIRDVIKKPKLEDGREWTIWQYSHREKLDGYVGEEKYIDMNVFKGTKEEFENFLKGNT